MAELLTPDICVIGAGSGGLSVAVAAAAFGVPVVLIEGGRMGGDRLNCGCVPSKALLAAAKRAHDARTGARFGVKAQRFRIDFLDAHAHVQDTIRALAPNDAKERLAGLGVQVIAGHARFTDRHTVAVDGQYTIRARRFVVATGSDPAVPPIPGLAECPYLTNESIFELTRCPQHLVVIGAGAVGLELAQAHRRLGAAVTVLEAARPLAEYDPECADVVLDQLARDGIVVRAGVTIARVERQRQRIHVVLAGAGRDDEAIEATHLLVAAGRKAHIEGLDLAAAGIAHDAHGIRVDKGLRTSNRKVYAIGDAVLGAPRFTHVADRHARLVIRNALFRLPVNAESAPLSRAVYTDPEHAHVGMTEDEARERHGAIRVLRSPYWENDRAQAEAAVDGHFKLVTDRRGRILGATIVGAHAGELIATWALAAARRMKVGALLDVAIPYPTRAEIGRRAAAGFYTPRLTNAWTRRIIGLLRHFG
jgi:pyruvate/2-oxoglutarate dehydrogenase complex dihydrolipoamide dehydrogenase (E3) component